MCCGYKIIFNAEVNCPRGTDLDISIEMVKEKAEPRGGKYCNRWRTPRLVSRPWREIPSGSPEHSTSQRERRMEKMTEIMALVREILDRAAGRIREFLTGSSGYELEEEKVRVPDAGKVVDARHNQRFPPADSPCDRY
jgi:hypothetical protein